MRDPNVVGEAYAVPFLVLPIWCLVLTSCLSPCDNEVLQEVPSPEGSYKAVVFQRDCGATTDFSTRVSVLPQGSEAPKGGGNVFVVDTSNGAAPVGPSGGPRVSVEWVADRRLVIAYDPRARTFRKEPNEAGVVVEYRSL